jgi:DNA-cytosine methyltransferase
MKILSLFDGISCARVALQRAGIPVEAYYASEIDKYAIQVSNKNYPDVRHIGSVVGLTFINPEVIDIDLLIGGSPCQDLSIAGKREGLAGKKSGLFYEYVRILNEVKPKYFILENVNSMSKEARDTITKELFGIEPVMINASLVSAQNRKRLFWVGKLRPNGRYSQVDITLPEDRNIFLKDIIHETRGEEFDLEKYIVKGNHLTWVTDEERLKKKRTNLNGDKSITMMARQYASWNGQYLSVRVGKFNKGGQGDRIYSTDGKSVALSAFGGGLGAKTGLYLVVPEATKQGYAIAEPGDSVDLSFPNSTTPRGRVGKKAKNLMTASSIGVVGNGYIRKLTPIECCRLQGLPDNHTQGISDSQAYKVTGNAFNVDVIAHILSFIK